MNRYKYIVVGNSAGGIAAVRAIRRADPEGPVLMLSDEPYPAYSRPLIAKHISEYKDIRSMRLVGPGFYEDNGIELRIATTAIALDIENHVIETSDGQEACYERLLLATGSKPIIPPVEGSGRRNVFTFTTYDDAALIASAIPSTERAVVVGGGFIGLSAADALAKRGISVTVVEMQDHLLSGMLDPVASSLVEDAARAAGVSVLTGRRVVSIDGSVLSGEGVSNVTLDDGTRLPCEMVIKAVGVHARTKLGGGQLRVERGYVVDETMRTSADDVFACGDAAQVYDYVRGTRGVAAVWPNAVGGGTVAGTNMAGEARTYSGFTTLNALPYFGLSVGSAGILDGPAEEGFESVVAQHAGAYRKVILRDDVVVGMVFAGDTTRCGLIYNLMKNGMRVGEWKDALVSDSFGLLSLPPELWQDGISDTLECGRPGWETV